MVGCFGTELKILTYFVLKVRILKVKLLIMIDETHLREDLYNTLIQYSIPALLTPESDWNGDEHPSEYFDRERGRLKFGIGVGFPSFSYFEIIRVLINKNQSKHVRLVSSSPVSLALYFYLSETIKEDINFDLYHYGILESPKEKIKILEKFHNIKIQDSNILNIQEIGLFENISYENFQFENATTFLDLPIGLKKKEKKEYILQTFTDMPDHQNCFAWLANTEYKNLSGDQRVMSDEIRLRILYLINIGNAHTDTSIEGFVVQMSKNIEYLNFLDEWKDRLDEFIPEEYKEEYEATKILGEYNNSLYFPLYFDEKNPDKFIYPIVDGIEDLNVGSSGNPLRVNPAFFVSFRDMELEAEISLEHDNFPFYPIRLYEICELETLDDSDIENFMNSVLEPNTILLSIFGKLTRIYQPNEKYSKKDLKKKIKQNYRKLIFKNEKIAKFYSSFFQDTKYGQLTIDRCKTGNVVPSISFSKFHMRQIPNFDEEYIDHQNYLHDIIQTLREDIKVAEKNRWNFTPEDAEEFLKKKGLKEESIEEYNLAYIPHPIASSFQWASSADSDEVYYERLLKAFECASHFYMMVLFSLKDNLIMDLSLEMDSSIKKSVLRTERRLFKQLSFGKSVLISKTISDKFKKLINNEKKFSSSGLNKYISYNYFEQLINPEIYEILTEIKTIRNDESAHSGAKRKSELNKLLEDLKNKRDYFLQRLTNLWRDSDLIIPTRLETRDGIRYYEFALATGPSTQFTNTRTPKITSQDLDQDALYLLDQTLGKSLEPMQIIPMIHRETAKEDVQTIYFFSRELDGEKSKFISYSITENKSEIEVKNTNRLKNFFSKIKTLEQKII